MTISNREPLLWGKLSSPRARRAVSALRSGRAPGMHLDHLEQRALLAAITFDGGGDGRNWFDPLNWSGDALPAVVDTVTITAAAGRAIRFDGTAAVASLRVEAPIEFASGSLTASGSVTFTARVTLAQQASITAGGTFTIARTQSATSAEAPGFESAAWRDRLDLAGSITAPSIFVSAGRHGALNVSGALTATGTSHAGRVELIGERLLLSGASVHADGPATGGDGGEVLIGGNYQGRGPQQNALRTYIDSRSVISASATANGHGGRVIVWSDEATMLAGTILARAAGTNFDGGFVEVSSKGQLGAYGRVDTQGGAGGDNGTLLLDPRDITIFSDNGSGDGQIGDSQVFFGDLGAIDITIWSIFIAANPGNVILQAQRDILFFSSPGAALNMANLGPGETLTLQAGRDVRVSQSITTAGGNVNIIAGDLSSPTPFAAGTIAVTAPIATSNGNITLTTQGTGGITSTFTLGAGSGTVTLNSGGGINLNGAVIAANLRSTSALTAQYNSGSNSVGTLAARVTGFGGAFNFNHLGNLNIGTVSGLVGIITNNGDSTILLGGLLLVSSPISTGEGQIFVQATNLAANTTITSRIITLVALSDNRPGLGDGATGDFLISNLEFTRFITNTLNIGADSGVMNTAALNLTAPGYNLSLLTGSNAINTAGIILAPGRTLGINVGTTLSQTGPIVVSDLNLTSNTGTINLTNAANAIGLVRGTNLQGTYTINSTGLTNLGPFTAASVDFNIPLTLTVAGASAATNIVGNVSMNGAVLTLNVNGPIVQTAGSILTASLALAGTSSATSLFTLAGNDISTITSTYTGSFVYADVNALTTSAITGGQNVNIIASGALTVASNATAAGSISLQAGAAGTGNLTLIGPGGFFIQSPTIRLIAGDGAGGINTATVNVGSAVFRGSSPGNSPAIFEFRQDAAVTSATLPTAAQFAGGLANIDYTVDSDSSSVTLTDTTKFSTTLLRVRANTTSTLNFPAVTLAGLDITGLATLSNASGPMSVTATSAGMSFGPLVLSPAAGTAVTLTSNTPVLFNSTVNPNAIGSASLTVTGGFTSAAALGGIAALRSISVTSGLTTIGGNVTTTGAGGFGAQTYSGPTRISADSFLSGTTFVFASTVDNAAGAARALSILATGSITFSGAVGATQALGSLITDTTSTVVINGGSVATTGIQFYSNTSGPLALINVDSPTGTTTFTGGAVNFSGQVRATAAGESIVVTTAGSAYFRGLPGAGGTNFVNATINGGGTATFQAGAVFSGALIVANTLNVNGDLSSTTLNAASITLSTVTAAFGQTLVLTSTGAKSLGGPVGTAGARLNSLVLTAGGSTSIGASIFVGNDFTLTSPTTFTGAATIDTLATFTNNAAVNTGPNALTIRAVEIAFNTTLSGTGALTLEPATSNQAVNVGPAALTVGLDLSAAELLNLADGFASIVVGRADGNGVLTVGTLGVPASAPTFRDPVTLREPVLGGSIVVNVSPTLTGNASLRFIGSGSTTILNASITTSGAQITFDDAVLINAAGISLSTNGGGAAAGATITFNFPLNASNPAFGLTLSAGTNGFTIFNSSVGATGPLGALVTDSGGSTVLAGPSVNAASITFNDAVLAATNTSLNSTGGVLFGQALNALPATTPNLSISAGGTILFAGAVGAVTALTSLTTGPGGTTTLASGSARTTGALTFNNPLTLTANTTLTGGSIILATNVTGATVNLTLNSPGTTAFGGVVTGIVALTTDIGGTTVLSNATIITTGDQRYNDAVLLTFGGDDPLPSVLTTAASFRFITFGSTVNAGPCDLTITADEIDFGGNVTGTGSLRLQPFTLAQNVLLSSAEGGGPDDPFKLEIDSGDYTKIMDGFTEVTVGTEGGTGDFEAGPFDTQNDVQLVMNGTSSGGQPGSFNVAGAIRGTDGSRIIIRGTGSTTHLFASITTDGGAITIDDAILLEVDGLTIATNLAPGGGTGGAVSITGRINSRASLLNSLSIFTRGGNVILGGAIGQLTDGQLGSLSIDTTRPTNVNPGIISIGGGFVTARNLISFLGPVTLTGPLTIATTGGPAAIVNFIGGINGNQNLTIAPGTGNVTFSGGGVGSTTSLTSITVNPGGSRIFSGAVTSQTLTIFGGTVEFNAPATIGSGVFISGTLQGSGDVTFTQPLTWIGGDMRGTGRTLIGPFGSLVISGASVKRLFRTIDSSGIVFWTDGDVQFASAGGGGPVGSFINRGTFYMQSAGRFIGTATGAAFSNLGFIERSGAGASSLTDLAITNTGQIAVTDGTLNLTPRSGLFTNQGTIALASAGTLAITGAFAQTPAAQFLTVLAGPGAGQFGRITATGTAALSGHLTVALAPGFVPTIGTSFDVVSAASVIGSFSTAFLPPNSASSRVALSYPGNAARLSVLDLADFNGDGVVDPDDLADFITNFFASPPGLGTDFNGDGTVDPDDLADFITAFFT